MAQLTLIIGNKNYSSWSLRPWLALRQAQIPFGEVRIPLYGPDSKARILRYSPSGKVPALVAGDVVVWDSLAICEYLAEIHPDRGLWPGEPRARAHARSISAEMHSGFPNLRAHLPMNIRGRIAGRTLTAEVAAEVERVLAIWQGCCDRYGGRGPFLFGEFTIADALYAPVALRFLTYGVSLPPAARAYADALLALPALKEWIAAAQAETEVLPRFEVGAP